ncbi:rho guanine nucleotide exchange factor 18a isoform X2 [Silurus meridionalis]|uniref:rho guanine nucleotide exchange factor 18a isoform X2 n=1 Tax=Silurus meridionalis TaxID=175797 RepID=UPI001EEB3C55|nr:rho guanine nucleotide exchange factor 18a isoform X2 [Silurus meridionalis]
MEESDQLRHRSVLDELTADGINIEDVQYSALREDLESDAQNFEAPTWSLAVDQQYVKNFSKDSVKRQDVIHELIQTEINHVRTLKLMLGVYLRELRDSLLMDESQLERLFPRLERLLNEHQNFLQRLKNRRTECLETGSDQNYCITNIGDILITQFSGDLRSRLQDSYGVFCSHHTEAVNFYKDQLQNNKKFQSLIRRIGQLSIVRRLGIPEGILLITQRITKYPVLVERIIKNTEAGTPEHQDLLNALECIKDTIFTVDMQVHQFEQLREIAAHFDPKSYSTMNNGKIFRKDDLLRNNRRLLREGVLTWRPQNRSKAVDVLMVLLPDYLLLLQEKDQKHIFASLDGKPAVLPLQKLIVREAAHSDRAMFLISASDVKAVLYEFQTSTAEERSSWRRQIWDTIETCPHVEEELMENEDVYSDKLREAHDQLCEKDAQIEEILRQKLQIFSEISEENSSTVRHLLLRGAATELLQGELLINNAIIQAESLQMQLMGEEMFLLPPSGESNIEPQRSSQTLPAFHRMTKNADGFRSKAQRPNSDPHLRDLYLHQLEISADDEGRSTLPPPQDKSEWIVSADKLIRTLYSLKVLVSQQDSELEVLRAAQLERERSSRQRFNSIQDQERQRHLEKLREELLQLQKVHVLQRQDQETWARERQRHLLDMHNREQELNRRMEECTNKEAGLCAERDVLNRSREEYQQDLERLRDSTRTVEKEKEKLEQEKIKLRKHKHLTHRGGATHLGGATLPDPAPKLLAPYPSPEDTMRSRSLSAPGVPPERPPLVPPRKESISITTTIKPDVPIQLLSTTNETMKSSSIQQQIPTKLAISKGKEKNKNKSAHHRTNSAASIEVSEVSPIKVTGKEGGSLRAMKTVKQHTPLQMFMKKALCSRSVNLLSLRSSR